MFFLKKLFFPQMKSLLKKRQSKHLDHTKETSSEQKIGTQNTVQSDINGLIFTHPSKIEHFLIF